MKLLLAAVILAHSWYPPECCNGEAEHGDCRPVPCAELTFRPGNPGWVVHEGHWIISDEVRQSPDGQCHVCERPDHERMYCAWMAYIEVMKSGTTVENLRIVNAQLCVPDGLENVTIQNNEIRGSLKYWGCGTK